VQGGGLAWRWGTVGSAGRGVLRRSATRGLNRRWAVAGEKRDQPGDRTQHKCWVWKPPPYCVGSRVGSNPTCWIKPNLLDQTQPVGSNPTCWIKPNLLDQTQPVGSNPGGQTQHLDQTQPVGSNPGGQTQHKCWDPNGREGRPAAHAAPWLHVAAGQRWPQAGVSLRAAGSVKGSYLASALHSGVRTVTSTSLAGARAGHGMQRGSRGSAGERATMGKGENASHVVA
jgi:hypothetical protein